MPLDRKQEILQWTVRELIINKPGFLEENEGLWTFEIIGIPMPEMIEADGGV